MLNKQGFNLWAQDYEQTVQQIEEKNSYPFAGYKEILNTVYNEVKEKENGSILDIGFGTGVLSKRLYDEGYSIAGIDFSDEMIRLAEKKMPNAQLVEWDISKGFPPELTERTFDFIVSTYALHHLTDEGKAEFIQELMKRLNPGGKILIGDIAFATRKELEACRLDNLHHWDEDEFYFVFDEFQESIKELSKSDFYPISHCGGVIVIQK
ncbi:class I SAM-dependent methyltransferase [Falsibacillus pallidus]|uniref:Putative AdoMet-dependent methyltransferase n=1 Tax=Falsibacillus pallidus TaxID=493781 RepID=A0A370GUB3_9BACI|nr:class I SAM-dependent methyltransferase [Falsibacillus pallidus]RDI45523.1 putative AdoMet-dependent methyltransferase [Falsibacillus pallidus]